MISSKKYLPLFTMQIYFAFIFNISAQIEMVDPTAELRREGTFVDTAKILLATNEQLNQWLNKQPKNTYFCFTEDRGQEIRFDDALPLSWLTRTPEERANFKGQPQLGETFLWQVGVYAPYFSLNNVEIQFQNLTNKKGDKIPSSAFECYNLEGIDKDGNHFKREISILKGKLQALWIGVNIPLNAYGIYKGAIILKVEGETDTKIPVTLDVKGEALIDKGVNDAWRKSRIRWINSKIGRSHEPTYPYTPLKREGNSIQKLGAVMELTNEGLPKSIRTHYDQSNQLDLSLNNEILLKPVMFIVETERGIEEFTQSQIKFTMQTPAVIQWETTLQNKDFEIFCNATMLFDGSITYKLDVKSLHEIIVKDIRTEFKFTDYASKYIMGLGNKGGLKPDGPINWMWDTTKQQDQIWLGNINAGLNIQFKDKNYKRPLVNIYYSFGPLQYPNSWGNNHKGGIKISSEKDGTLLTAYIGNRNMRRGEMLSYNFDLMITPVKPIDFKNHFKDRFYHHNADTTSGFIPTALQYGANLINIHHKTDIYPFLNYPMAETSAPYLKAFIQKAHSLDLGVRIYYTCRELTVKTPEFWILRSMGEEIIMDGPGNAARTLIHPKGPKPWLIENLRTHYIPGWYAAFSEGRYKGELDIAVITTPESRWCNYYLEGLNWMIKELDIDGIYVDDSSLDGESMRRARRILDADGKRRLIDMHTWNHMNEHGGYANSLQLYTKLLPYINRLWIGELFKADNPRDFWLIEMSGIPYGLMSETLDAHNMFRGMTFGMLPRLPWSGNPAPMWKLIDKYDITNFHMYGYWDERNSFESDNENISGTTYLGDDTAMIVIANWNNNESESATIKIDPKKLGFIPSKTFLPGIEGLQSGDKIDFSKAVEIPTAKGIIAILQK